MKRRGGAAAQETASNVVASDVDDRALSAEAARRAAKKEVAESIGRTNVTNAQPLPFGLIAVVGAVVLGMLYLTIKFSS